MIKKIGLIAGNGDFPIAVAKEAKKKGVSIVAVALKEEANPELEKFVDIIYWVGMGELRMLIDIFKKEKVKKAIMAGKVTKVRLFKGTPRLDSATQNLLNSANDKKDISLLKSAAAILRLFGITLIDSTYFLKDYLPKRGVLSRREPTKEEWEDIKFGFALAKKISHLDIGQTVVIKSKTTLAVESIEGTDEAILRGGKLGNGNIVVVKTARPRQDKRFDMPTIGPHTIESLSQAGGNVLAIEAGKTLLLNREKCISLADEKGFSLVAV